MGPTTSTEFSAGGVVVRDGQCVVIVPTRLAANGAKVLALPKGHPEEGESPSEAALREVREEAGVVARWSSRWATCATGTRATAGASPRW